MQIFFSVGEPSGDLHGANLIQALKNRHPDWEFVGYGGPKMKSAGCHLHADLTQLAVMWLAQALWNIRKFLDLLGRADRYFQQQRPDMVILIDYPGFNWWIARKAKAAGIPVVYYGTPQLWAWAGWRVSKMRRFVDHALCKLPFEQKWFKDRGCHATFVGHPYFDELRSRTLDRTFVDQQAALPGPLVTILPGSRTQEIGLNLPEFLKTAQLIQQEVPKARFAIAVFKQQQLEMVNNIVQQSGQEAEVHVARTAELIHSARCCLACSGSVSLELLYHTKPSAILYQISRLGYTVQKVLRKVRYITLVNLLTADDPFADRSAGIYDPADPRDQHVLMPEYLTCKDRTADLAKHLVHWLTDAEQYKRREQELVALKDQVAQGGASQRAADYISHLVQPANTDASGTVAAPQTDAA
ncbi:MAG: lipid-A-disaccharide synthase [Planctomycetes bacterium]|nr:lipid-A-disaccharide synthase [Planctomycetota bacterium]